MLAGLVTCDPDYPIHECDRIIDQCKLVLNLLRKSGINLKLSAWVYIHRMHDYNKIPLTPPGTKVIMHKKLPTERAGLIMAWKVVMLDPHHNITAV